MTNVMISTLLSSTFLFYVVIYHFHLLMMCISRLLPYARACFAYDDFSKRGKLLTKKFMLLVYDESRLKSSFRKFYSRYNDLVCEYKLSLAHMLNDLFHTLCYIDCRFHTVMTCNPVYLISTKGARRV
jgi:hypothetical protein